MEGHVKYNTAFTDHHLKQFATKLYVSTLCRLAEQGVHVTVAPQSLSVDIKC